MLLFLTPLMVGSAVAAPTAVSKDTVLMGSAFSFTAVDENPQLAWNAIVAGIQEVERIEAMISSWQANSQTSGINRKAGIEPVAVSPELIALLERCDKISRLSNGFFDVSFASIDKVWDFSNPTPSLPSDKAIAASVANIGHQNIVIDKVNTTVMLKKPGMKIGFGAIGKGFAADRAKVVMEELGIQSGVVNAGGDLLAWGQRPDGAPWSVGIADPKEKTNILSWLSINNRAVATSGNYEKFLTIKGERYCHIINPKTGWPVKGLQSATIVCNSAELADALATTVFVLGVSDGLKLIDHLQGVEAILVDHQQAMHFSKNIEQNLVAGDEKAN